MILINVKETTAAMWIATHGKPLSRLVGFEVELHMLYLSKATASKDESVQFRSAVNKFLRNEKWK